MNGWKHYNPSFEIAKAARDVLERELELAKNEMNRIAIELNGGHPIDRSNMGLTPEHIRMNPVYRQAKQRYNTKFQALRNFNSSFVRDFKNELREERSRGR